MYIGKLRNARNQFPPYSCLDRTPICDRHTHTHTYTVTHATDHPVVTTHPAITGVGNSWVCHAGLFYAATYCTTTSDKVSDVDMKLGQTARENVYYGKILHWSNPRMLSRLRDFLSFERQNSRKNYMTSANLGSCMSSGILETPARHRSGGKCTRPQQVLWRRAMFNAYTASAAVEHIRCREGWQVNR